MTALPLVLQIDIILAGDPQLAKEILYDMRQADNAQRVAAELAATAPRSGGAASAEAARRLSGSRTPGSGRGPGGRAPDLRQEALKRSLQLPRSSGSRGAHGPSPRFALRLRCTSCPHRLGPADWLPFVSAIPWINNDCP